jgi:transposase
MKRYRVTLEAHERNDLEKLVSRGKALARRLTHARILLLADESPEAPADARQRDDSIAKALGVNLRTVERLRERFVERGLTEALDPLPSKRTYQRKLDGKGEAQLVALACSAPPEGYARWTMRLLADAMVELEYIDSISHETVSQVLKKTRSSLG